MIFVQARNHGPANNFPINRIVIHGTVTQCVPGGARAVARMFANTSRDASTQYIVDPGEIVQAVRDDTIAYGAPPNKGAIHVEQCDMQEGPASRWQDANHQAMLRLAAALVARLCLKYDVPIRKLNAADLKAGRRGICGHSDVSQAWHQTTHVDPGTAYPWDQFLALVREAANPKPTPPARPSEDEVSAFASLKTGPKAGAVYITNFLGRRWIPAAAYKGFMVDAGVDPHIYEFDSEAGLNAFAGPLVGDDYTPEA